VAVFDLVEGKSVFRGWEGRLFRPVALDPEGKTLAAGALGGSGVWVRDLASGTEERLPVGNASVRALAYTSDGRRLVAGLAPWDGRGPSLLVWDRPGVKPRSLTSPGPATGNVWSLAIAPDNTTAVSAAQDGRIIVWDLASGSVVHEFPSLEVRNVSPSVAIAPDGKTLAVGHDYLVRFYRWGTWEPTGEKIPLPDGDTVWGLAYVRDGRWLATVGRSLVCWEVETGEKVRHLDIRQATVRGIAPSHGQLAALGGNRDHNGLVHVLDLRQLDEGR
jgi:WD40 repeat protein